MSLEPFFSLSAKNPFYYGYDASNPESPYADAFFFSMGGYTYAWNPWSFGAQHQRDEIIIGYDAVKPDNEIFSSPEHPWTKNIISIGFKANNVDENNQFLIVANLNNPAPHLQVTAQFFIGTEFVDSENVEGDEQHALLLDCPGEILWTSITIRLASDHWGTVLGFKGVTGYLL